MCGGDGAKRGGGTGRSRRPRLRPLRPHLRGAEGQAGARGEAAARDEGAVDGGARGWAVGSGARRCLGAHPVHDGGAAGPRRRRRGHGRRRRGACLGQLPASPLLPPLAAGLSVFRITFALKPKLGFMIMNAMEDEIIR
uniref:Uncharacterized protein n=1 Tax=Oryza sativa subsp. japonica TaxID=39947 RepID=Q5Z5Q5_ORYSJ|nr:hypothetical protein [Oryza sativa Japonica Group]